MISKSIFFQCGILCVASLLSGMTFNRFNKNGLDTVRKPVIQPAYQRIQEQDPEKAKRLSLDEAYTLFKTKAALFVDARQEVLYKMAHIKDAEWIYHQTAKENPKLKDYPRERLMVVYCGGPKCEQAEHLMGQLEELGFTNVFLFSGGMDAWRAAGYPIDELPKK